MKKAAIDKARKRVALAREHLHAVGRSETYEQFEPAWSQFLVVTNSIEGILEFGCRARSVNKPWFGTKINKRRGDPLLSYMHQARNVDEHGIEPVVEHVRGGWNLTAADGGSMHIKKMVFKNGVLVEFDPGDQETILEVVLPHVRLTTVIDERFGDRYDPPTHHLGVKLPDADPLKIALLWLTYLEGLVDEAEARVTL